MDWFWNLAIFIPIATESWPLICGGPERCHTLYIHFSLQPLQPFYDFNWMLAVFFPNVQCLFVVFLRYKVCHTLCKHFPLQPLSMWCEFHWSHSPGQRTARKQLTGRFAVCYKHIDRDSKLLKPVFVHYKVSAHGQQSIYYMYIALVHKSWYRKYLVLLTQNSS